MLRRVVVAFLLAMCAMALTGQMNRSAVAAGVTIQTPGGRTFRLPSGDVKLACNRYYATRSSPTGGIRPPFDPDTVCPTVGVTPPPTILQRVAGAAAQGVADTTSNWVVDGATTA